MAMYIQNTYANYRQEYLKKMFYAIIVCSEVISLKYSFVDSRISQEEMTNLENIGIKPIKVPPSDLLYDAVCGHPDILINIIDNNTIVVHRDMPYDFINLLKGAGFEVILSVNSLSSSYPGDIILNAVNTEHFFMHSLKYTDAALLNLVKNKKKLNIKQGYSKCSTALVTENAAMTSDNSISEQLGRIGMDVLLLPPGDILLPGLDYGFIGGTCGLITKNKLAFFGDLNFYAYGHQVENFLRLHGVEPVFLRSGKLIDRGSLLTVNR